MFCLYKDNYQAAIGEFELRISSSLDTTQNVELKEQEVRILTAGHQIDIRRVQALTKWLPDGVDVSAAEAWMFYVKKLNSARESLRFTYNLVAAGADISADSSSGQWLTAIELYNDVHQVHIGTQDEDRFALEADRRNWVPKRLADPLGTWSLIVTTIETYGLITQLPELLEGEQFYFHYILAESLRRKSEEYPDEWDVSTWCAVEQSGETLERVWSQQTKKPPW